jgi:hypothetical protein
MENMPSLIRKIIVVCLLAILSIAMVIAQGACPDLLETALQSVEDNCAGLGRNEVCYGYNNVQASFISEVAEDFFSQVSDKSPVAELASVQTLPMNTETGQWGVAVMNLQANVPNTLPGTNVTFVLLGDVEVENAVAPEDAFVPSDGIGVSLAVESANLRSGAGLTFNVVGGVLQDETLIADGVSEDGEWLRVVKNGRPAWLHRSLVVENAEIETLPVLTDELRMPMQAFYLRTGLSRTECVEVPDNLLVVQGPENLRVQLSINGANVSLGSTGAFSTIEVDGQLFLELVVFDGSFEIDGTLVRAGQRTVMCLDNESSRGLDGESNDLVVSCAPSRPEPVENFGEAWCNIESLPSSLLNYRIEVLCPGETPIPVATTAPIASTDDATGAGLVDCKSFAILTGDIPATSFTLSWTGIIAADTYEIAVFDNSGYQVSSTMTGGTSLDMNGGVSFPPAGYVDVRAYGGGAYLCYARQNFTRSVDPHEPTPRASGNVVINCSFDSFVFEWTISVTWSNVVAPVVVGYMGTSSFPQSDSQVFNSSSGSYGANPSDLGTGSMTVHLNTGDGQNYSKNC